MRDTSPHPPIQTSIHTRHQTQCRLTMHCARHLALLWQRSPMTLVTLTRHRILGACRPMSKIVPGAILLVMAYGIVSSDVFGITKPLAWSASGSGTVADSLTSSGASAVAAAVSSAAAQRTEYSDPFKLPWGYRPLVAQPCRWAAVPAVLRHSTLHGVVDHGTVLRRSCSLVCTHAPVTCVQSSHTG